MSDKEIPTTKHRVGIRHEAPMDRPVRVGNMGTMEVNAHDQLGPDETGEMMHRSDAIRNQQLLEDLSQPETDTEVERAERKGYHPKPATPLPSRKSNVPTAGYKVKSL